MLGETKKKYSDITRCYFISSYQIDTLTILKISMSYFVRTLNFVTGVPIQNGTEERETEQQL